MINIRCSSLQDVKSNPAGYAQLLHDGFDKNGGSRGMLAYWQDIARKILKENLTINEAVKELERIYVRFADNRKNNQRREFLLEQLVKFSEQCRKRKFKWADGQHRIKWELQSGVMLTGLTPIVVKAAGEFYCFAVAEELPGWEEELRFPLFQQYLAQSILDCGINEINIGIYLLSKKDFEFRKYTASELKEAVDETAELFKQVQTIFNNYKKD
jgi:hypothetical protein